MKSLGYLKCFSYLCRDFAVINRGKIGKKDLIDSVAYF